MSQADRQGFTLIELIIIVVILVIVGSLGVVGYRNFIAPKEVPVSQAMGNSSVSSIVVEESDTIMSSAGLDAATSDLDAMSFDDADMTELETTADQL